MDDITHFDNLVTKCRNRIASRSSASGQWRPPTTNESGVCGKHLDVVGEYEVLNSVPVAIGPFPGVLVNAVLACCGVHIRSCQSRVAGRKVNAGELPSVASGDVGLDANGSRSTEGWPGVIGVDASLSDPSLTREYSKTNSTSMI